MLFPPTCSSVSIDECSRFSLMLTRTASFPRAARPRWATSGLMLVLFPEDSSEGWELCTAAVLQTGELPAAWSGQPGGFWGCFEEATVEVRKRCRGGKYLFFFFFLVQIKHKNLFTGRGKMFKNSFKVVSFSSDYLMYFSDQILLSIVGYGTSRESDGSAEGESWQKESEG